MKNILSDTKHRLYRYQLLSQCSVLVKKHTWFRPPEFPVELGLTAAGRKAGRSVGEMEIADWSNRSFSAYKPSKLRKTPICTTKHGFSTFWTLKHGFPTFWTLKHRFSIFPPDRLFRPKPGRSGEPQLHWEFGRPYPGSYCCHEQGGGTYSTPRPKSQVKSRITPRDTWSTRHQAGAMRPVRRAGWVWAAGRAPAAKSCAG